MYELVIAPRVSIVTPAYNYGKYCGELVDSVMSQTYPFVEHIIVDDGSTDDTPDVLASLVKRYGSRLVVIRQRNAGQAVAVNRGLLAATGNVVLWINSDDLMAPWAVEEGVQALREHPEAAAVYGDWARVDAAGKLLEEMRPGTVSIEELLLGGFFIANCALFIRKEVLHDVGLLDPVLRSTLDWDFVVRIALRHEIAYSAGRPWAYYRDHSTTKTNIGRIVSAREYNYLYEKVLARPDLPKSVLRLSRLARSKARWQSAICFAFGRAPVRAALQALLSFLLDPIAFLVTRHFEPHPRIVGVGHELRRRLAAAGGKF
ncbi:MAG: glycosyltransferase [Terracidiphilus sp.]|jgi:glycosyltransferase involved in cell wall biosynthesis